MDKEITFYKKLATYGHQQFGLNIPKEIHPLVKKGVVYKVTLVPVTK